MNRDSPIVGRVFTVFVAAMLLGGRFTDAATGPYGTVEFDRTLPRRWPLRYHWNDEFGTRHAREDDIATREHHQIVYRRTPIVGLEIVGVDERGSQTPHSTDGSSN
ncbi:hypothetical protein [Natrinema gelatinilyticum]|uniref:hypothetical protein n=1 Tax=Natrinema gelatinilyticum TaxID=2961571 RepID=UPI0031F2FB31